MRCWPISCNAGEEERGRIAEGIHDDSIQAITAAGMRLQILRRSLHDPEQLQLLGELEKTIQLSISRLRHLLFELRPPELDTEGLSAALELYLDETQSDGATQLPARGQLERAAAAGDANDSLPHRPGAPGERPQARAGRERDRRCSTSATRATQYGCPTTASGLIPRSSSRCRVISGLTAMQERAALAGGWLRIDSAPGKGTTVEVWIPSQARPGDGRC